MCSRCSSQGIYPTIIIVLVCLQLTFHDNVTRAETVPSRLENSNEKTGRDRVRQILSWRIPTTARGGSTSGADDPESTQTQFENGMSFESSALAPIKSTTTPEQDVQRYRVWEENLHEERMSGG